MPPGGPTRQVPPSRVGSSSVWVSAVGTVVDVAPGSVVVVEPSGGVVVVEPSASVVPVVASVVVGAAPVEDVDGGDVVVGAAAAGERSPAGNVVSPAVVGELADVVGDVGGSVVEDPVADVVVAPATVVVVSPGTVVEVADGSWRADALDHWAQRDDAGDVGGVQRLALVAHAREVDDDVLALDAHVGLGDAAVLQLGPDQVTDDDEVVVGGPLGRRQDDGQTALQVEAQRRRVADDQVERRGR